jgi:hypothetical protein
MFFVTGLTSDGREVFVNPDHVLYARPAGLLRKKTALIMAHRHRLVVDQDPPTVRQCFEQYLKDAVYIVDDPADSERRTNALQRSIVS